MSVQTELLERISEGIYNPESEEDVNELTKQALADKIPVLTIVDALTHGISVLGDKFDSMDVFLPELIVGADIMEDAMKILTPEIEKLSKDKETVPVKIVIANLQGDIHDIGREILCTMCRVAGFTVYNLGNDMKAGDIIDEAIAKDADFIGLSSLLTTSLPFAKDLISLLGARNMRDRFTVLMGGGAVTPDYVNKIGADGYSLTATEAVKLITKMYDTKAVK